MANGDACGDTYICEVCGRLATECACTVHDRIAWLQHQLREAQAKLDEGANLVFIGPSVPKREVDALKAEHAGRCDEYEAKLHETREFLGEEQKALVRAEAKLQQAQEERDRARKALVCGHCGKTKPYVAICFDCLNEDVEEVARWHREVDVSDANGSWDECQQCHTTWPCDAIKALRLRDAAIERGAAAWWEYTAEYVAWEMAFRAVGERAEAAERRMDGWAIAMRQANRITVGLRADAAAQRALAEKGQQLREELEEVGNHAVGILWDGALLDEWDALKAPAEVHPQQEEGCPPVPVDTIPVRAAVTVVDYVPAPPPELEGWLEVREQALDDFDRWQDEHMAAEPGKIPGCLGRGCPACKLARERLRAALDALGGT